MACKFHPPSNDNPKICYYGFKLKFVTEINFRPYRWNVALTLHDIQIEPIDLLKRLIVQNICVNNLYTTQNADSLLSTSYIREVFRYDIYLTEYKVKFPLCLSTKTLQMYEGAEIKFHEFLSSAQDGGERSASRSGRSVKNSILGNSTQGLALRSVAGSCEHDNES
jgi:hypothetical protein